MRAVGEDTDDDETDAGGTIVPSPVAKGGQSEPGADEDQDQQLSQPVVRDAALRAGFALLHCEAGH